MNDGRLDVLKTLGDNTRYAVYLEVVRAPSPRATADVASALGLHANTVRPHLERMREVGLLELHVTSTGGVGRPQHRYGIAADAPTFGLEPPAAPMLAGMLVRLATNAGVAHEDAVDIGREQGRVDAGRYHPSMEPARALHDELSRLGFDPEMVADTDHRFTVAFAHCPFREHAEAHPEVVCGLHRGMVEGFVGCRAGLTVQDFRTVADRNPCQVDLAPLVPA